MGKGRDHQPVTVICHRLKGAKNMKHAHITEQIIGSGEQQALRLLRGYRDHRYLAAVVRLDSSSVAGELVGIAQARNLVRVG